MLCKLVLGDLSLSPTKADKMCWLCLIYGNKLKINLERRVVIAQVGGEQNNFSQ